MRKSFLLLDFFGLDLSSPLLDCFSNFAFTLVFLSCRCRARLGDGTVAAGSNRKIGTL